MFGLLDMSKGAICQINNSQKQTATSLSDKEAGDSEQEKLNASGHWCYLSQCVPLINQAVSELFVLRGDCFHLFICKGKVSDLIKKNHYCSCCKSFTIDPQGEPDTSRMSEILQGEKTNRLNLAREPFSSVTLYCRIWLLGDWERAAWRLLSFLSVRDGNTHGLWGWLPEILWRGLLLAQTLQVRDQPLDTYQEDSRHDGKG